MLSIGGDLSKEHEAGFRQFLRGNWDICAWKPMDMPGVPAKIAEHSLDI